MPRKTIVMINLEKGLTCNNCGLSYRSFVSREEKIKCDLESKNFVPNVCGSKLRKKLNLPKDFTCEHWYKSTETFSAENKLVDEKVDENKEKEE